MLKVDAVIVMRFGVGLTDEEERSIVWANKEEGKGEVLGKIGTKNRQNRPRSKERKGREGVRENSIKLTNEYEG